MVLSRAEPQDVGSFFLGQRYIDGGLDAEPRAEPFDGIAKRIIRAVVDQLLVIVSVTVVAMLSPGPDMVLVLRNTFLRGRRAGLETSLGVLCANLVHITYCVFGIGLLISQSILAFSLLKVAGAAFLIYLGVLGFRTGTLQDQSDIKEQRPMRAYFAQGFLSNLLNPKATLFYLGVFTMVVTADTTPRTTLVLVGAMLLVSTLFWVGFVGTTDRPLMRRSIERSQRTINRLFGGLLILLGLRLAATSR